MFWNPLAVPLPPTEQPIERVAGHQVGEFPPDIKEQGPILEQVMLRAVSIRKEVVLTQKALSPELVRDRQRSAVHGGPRQAGCRSLNPDPDQEFLSARIYFRL